jgi:hypothetical protein
MQHSPDHFLQEKTGKDDLTTKSLNDFIYKITFELSKNTNEISFLIIEEELLLEFS